MFLNEEKEEVRHSLLIEEVRRSAAGNRICEVEIMTPVRGFKSSLVAFFSLRLRLEGSTRSKTAWLEIQLFKSKLVRIHLHCESLARVLLNRWTSLLISLVDIFRFPKLSNAMKHFSTAVDYSHFRLLEQPHLMCVKATGTCCRFNDLHSRLAQLTIVHQQTKSALLWFDFNYAHSTVFINCSATSF